MRLVGSKKDLNRPREVIIITTGGTIEKTYDEFDGSLSNRESIVQHKILSKLRLPYVKIRVFSILSKDSLHMDDNDRNLLKTSIENHLTENTPVVVLHGTDTMEVSSKYCLEHILEPKAPIIFTGAMKPLGFEDSDALQNITEAIYASGIVDKGVYVSFHGKIFQGDKVRKNHEKGTFESL